MMTFAWPWMLLCLPLPYGIWKWIQPGKQPPHPKQTQHTGLFIPYYQDMIQSMEKGPITPHSNTHSNAQHTALLPWLPAAIWVLIVIASMRPQSISNPIPYTEPGRNIVLAIDISGSMQETDLSTHTTETRLDIVKHIAHTFIDRRPLDQLGLVLFGSQAFVATPLTFDHATVHRFLEETQIGFAGPGTAIGDALAIAIERLALTAPHSRVLILLSDGSNTSGKTNPTLAAQLAAQYNIKIYTIGVGNNQPNALDQLRGTALDERTLKSIAQKTGGLYFYAKDAKRLQAIYEQINQLEPSIQKHAPIRIVLEYFTGPLAGAVVLMFLLLIRLLLPRPIPMRYHD